MRAIDRLLRNRPKAGGLSLLGKIRALFANGEQGWWYDPSNLSTLFQDRAGTTPVTAMEQPVGLQLDLSKGLALGSELVTNGDFSAGTTGWSATAGAVLSVISGELEIKNGTANYGFAYQSFPTVVGKTYKVSASGRIGSTSQIRVTVGTGAGTQELGILPFTSSTTATKTLVFTATATNTVVNGINQTNVVGNTGYISNISVRELPGNHRFQTTSANRPVVSARVNLLTKTEEFNDAAWTKTNVTVTANAIVAPDGTLTADKVEATASASTEMRQDATVLATEIIATARIKKGSGANDMNRFQIRSITAGATLLAIAVNLDNGVITYVNGSTGATVTADADGWFVVRMVVPITSGHTIRFSLGSNGSNETAGEFSYIWGADLRVANVGVNLPVYQRVNTSTDYDSTGFPIYIKPNGSNQFMQTNSINFTATDKMTVWQGVRKLSLATTGALVELGTNSESENSSFGLFIPTGASQFSNLIQLRGTARAAITIPTTAPVTEVLSVAYDIGATDILDEIKPRINGAIPSPISAVVPGPAGTGNYGNYPAYFYMRAGTSLAFNGHDYGSIARGAASNAAQITAGETYINSKTKAFV